MEWTDILLVVLPFVLTFLLGLVIKSPIYDKVKKGVTLLAKDIEDDKLTKEELKELWDAITKKL
jgi:hypothetical protein